MGFLSASYSPNLFYRIEVGRIRRQGNDSNSITDVGVFFFGFNQSLRFLVPGSIVHDQDDSLVVSLLDLCNKLFDAGYRGFIIEPGRL